MRGFQRHGDTICIGYESSGEVWTWGIDATRAGSRGIARWRRFEEGVLGPFHRTVVLLKPQKPGLQYRKEEPQNLSP